MSPRLRSIAAATVLTGLTLVGYGWVGGGSAALNPPNGEAAVLIEQAQSIARSGRDLDGRASPLFFRINDERWLQPVPVYFTALGFALGVPAAGSHWFSVALGALNVALLFIIATRLLNRMWLGAVAAALLALTPAHFTYSRLVSDAIYPVPFVLAWLLGLLLFIEKTRLIYLVAASLCLGIGVYTQAAAPITMSVCMVITAVTLWRTGHRRFAPYVAVGAAFATPLLLLLPWFLQHPETYRDTLGRWAVHQAHLRFPLDGLRAFVNWTTLGTRASLYWGFFDPSWLFLAAPGRAAPFLLPLVILVPTGVWALLASGRQAVSALLLLTTAAVPLAAATFGEPHAIAQALAVAPLMTLIATWGVAAILRQAPHQRRT